MMSGCDQNPGELLNLWDLIIEKMLQLRYHSIIWSWCMYWWCTVTYFCALLVYWGTLQVRLWENGLLFPNAASVSTGQHLAAQNTHWGFFPPWSIYRNIISILKIHTWYGVYTTCILHCSSSTHRQSLRAFSDAKYLMSTTTQVLWPLSVR